MTAPIETANELLDAVLEIDGKASQGEWPRMTGSLVTYAAYFGRGPIVNNEESAEVDAKMISLYRTAAPKMARALGVCFTVLKMIRDADSDPRRRLARPGETELSYSRWSHSKWYTYHDTASGDTLDNQVFTICGDGSFTYRELKDDLETCMKRVDGDEELVGYVKEWFEDMESEFKPLIGGETQMSKSLEEINPSRFHEMPNPTETDLADPVFESIWQVIKSWDVNVPDYYSGYCGASGSHVMLILNALRAKEIQRIVVGGERDV